MTELLYLRDAYLQAFTATVIDTRTGDDGTAAIALDRTAFYPTGGGQPHDVGELAGLAVVDVRKEGDVVWHTVAAAGDVLPGVGDVLPGVGDALPGVGDALLGVGDALPTVGTEVVGQVDWSRRHRLMRTHTALHVLCGVIWNEWRVPVTGGNMEPLAARMDFEFDPVPEGFGPRIEELVNAELAADRPIEVHFLPRDTAVHDDDLIRTKVSLIPESVAEIRVVDIVGLDKQADGGTHVRSTSEVGRLRVLKLENKGKGNKRVRVEIIDA